MAWTPPAGCYRRAGFQGNFAGKGLNELVAVKAGLREQIQKNRETWTEDEEAIWRHNMRLVKSWENDIRRGREDAPPGYTAHIQPTPSPRPSPSPTPTPTTPAPTPTPTTPTPTPAPAPTPTPPPSPTPTPTPAPEPTPTQPEAPSPGPGTPPPPNDDDTPLAVDLTPTPTPAPEPSPPTPSPTPTTPAIEDDGPFDSTMPGEGEDDGLEKLKLDDANKWDDEIGQTDVSALLDKWKVDRDKQIEDQKTDTTPKNDQGWTNPWSGADNPWSS